jgi:hypothetical protein
MGLGGQGKTLLKLWISGLVRGVRPQDSNLCIHLNFHTQAQQFGRHLSRLQDFQTDFQYA